MNGGYLYGSRNSSTIQCHSLVNPFEFCLHDECDYKKCTHAQLEIRGNQRHTISSTTVVFFSPKQQIQKIKSAQTACLMPISIFLNPNNTNTIDHNNIFIILSYQQQCNYIILPYLPFPHDMTVVSSKWVS
jgi:hypothetical protein